MRSAVRPVGRRNGVVGDRGLVQIDGRAVGPDAAAAAVMGAVCGSGHRIAGDDRVRTFTVTSTLSARSEARPPPITGPAGPPNTVPLFTLLSRMDTWLRFMVALVVRRWRTGRRRWWRKRLRRPCRQTPCCAQDGVGQADIAVLTVKGPTAGVAGLSPLGTAAVAALRHVPGGGDGREVQAGSRVEHADGAAEAALNSSPNMVVTDARGRTWPADRLVVGEGEALADEVGSLAAVDGAADAGAAARGPLPPMARLLANDTFFRVTLLAKMAARPPPTPSPKSSSVPLLAA